VAYLRAKEQWGAAAQQLADLVNDDGFRSIEGAARARACCTACVPAMAAACAQGPIAVAVVLRCSLVNVAPVAAVSRCASHGPAA
jgi:hypothetical protein